MGYIEPTKVTRKSKVRFSRMLMIIILALVVAGVLLLKNTNFFEKDMSQSYYCGGWAYSAIQKPDGEVEYIQQVSYNPDYIFNENGTGIEFVGEEQRTFYWREHEDFIVYMNNGRGFGGGYFLKSDDNKMYYMYNGCKFFYSKITN